MQANETHISLETAKLLKGCGIEWYRFFVEDWYWDRDFASPCFWYDRSEYPWYGNYKNVIQTYTQQEILREYAEEFFGIEQKYWDDQDYFDNLFNIQSKTKKILELLQQKKYQEADLFFRKHCVLIK